MQIQTGIPECLSSDLIHRLANDSMDKGDMQSNTTSLRTEHISKKSKQDSDNETQCTTGVEELSHMPGRLSYQNAPEDNDDVGGDRAD